MPLALTKPLNDSLNWGDAVNKNFTDIEALVNSIEIDLNAAEVDIAAAEAAIIVNAGNIATNASDIDDLETAVALLISELDTAEAAIVTNAGNISDNADDIDAAEAAIIVNADDIATNVGHIATNQGNISDNADDIDTAEAFIMENRSWIGFHDRGDLAAYDFVTANFTTDATWRDLDLSTLVPDGTSLVALRFLIQDNLVGQTIQLRTKGNANVRNIADFQTIIANQWARQTIWVVPDADRIIQYNISNTVWTFVLVVVRGYLLGG